ncbi:MAG: M48 family metalloprotease [Acidimicrobiales bacterium]
MPPNTTFWRWLIAGPTRTPIAAVAALLAGWTALPLALWAGVLGAIFGLIFVLLHIFGNHVSFSVFHLHAAATLTIFEALGSVVTGAAAGFALFYVGSLFSNPQQVALGIVLGAVVAIAITAVIALAEPTWLALRGYATPSDSEEETLTAALEQVASNMGLDTLPLVRIADIPVARAWTHLRTIVVTKGLLNLGHSDDEQLHGVLAHELHHWAQGDSVSLRFVWASALPLALAYDVGHFLIGYPLDQSRVRSAAVPGMSAQGPETLGRASRGIITLLGWVLIWPAWLLTKVIGYVGAAEGRRLESEADHAAAKAGFGDGLREALNTMVPWDGGRTGWENAMMATHPRKQVRIDDLDAYIPTEEPYKEPAPKVPGKNALVYLLATAVLIPLAVWALQNAPNGCVPIKGGCPTKPKVAPPVTPPSGRGSTNGVAENQDGAVVAARSFVAAIFSASLNRDSYQAVVVTYAAPSAQTALAQEADSYFSRGAAAGLAAQGATITPQYTSAIVRTYTPSAAGDTAVVDIAYNLVAQLHGQSSISAAYGPVSLVWYANGWRVTDIQLNLAKSGG